eukprot:403363573
MCYLVTALYNQRASSMQAPPQSNGFTKNYAQFFGLERQQIPQEISQAAKDLHSQTLANQAQNSTNYMNNSMKRLNQKQSGGKDEEFRIKTNLRRNPDFQVNLNKFWGQEVPQDVQFKKNENQFFKVASKRAQGNSVINNSSNNGFAFKSNLSNNANNILSENTKRFNPTQTTSQSVDKTAPVYQKDVKRFFGLPSTHYQRGPQQIDGQMTNQFKAYEGVTQSQVLGDAFEQNRKAFFNAYTPDPTNKTQKKKQSNRFEKYLKNGNDQKLEVRNIDSKASSYVAAKDKFFGLEDPGNSYNKNSKIFYGFDNNQDQSQLNQNVSGGIGTNFLQRPKDFSNFYQTKNKVVSLTKESYGALPGTTYNIITGTVIRKE